MLETCEDLLCIQDGLKDKIREVEHEKILYKNQHEAQLEVIMKLKQQVEDTVLEMDQTKSQNQELTKSNTQLCQKVESLRQLLNKSEHKIKIYKSQNLKIPFSTSKSRTLHDSDISKLGENSIKEEVEQEKSQGENNIKNMQNNSSFDNRNYQKYQEVLIQLQQLCEQKGILVKSQEVQLKEELGRGSFAKAFKAVWRGALVVAKQIDTKEDVGALKFSRELQCMSSIRHPNVVLVYGIVVEPNDRLWLIIEYMQQGTLKQWLYQSRQMQAFFNQNEKIILKLEKALEVARGMLALHENDPPIIHRDLKPSNVFIDANGVAKVGDFGLAKFQVNPHGDQDNTGETGTYLYMAPEVISHELYGLSADVYSWGVMFVELILQQLPFQNTYLTAVQIAMAVSQHELVPQVPKQVSNISLELYQVIEQCFHKVPESRPTFQRLVIVLSHVVDQIRAKKISIKH